MKDFKEVLIGIFKEHLYYLQGEEITPSPTYSIGWNQSRVHILGLFGFENEQIDTSAKLIKIIEKYQEEIKSWEQNTKEEKNVN